MSILANIRAEIGAAFSNESLFFSAATLTRASGTGGWDDAATSVSVYPCKAMISGYSDHLRAVADIPGEDAKVLIVGTSISVDPLKGDTVTVAGKGWRLIAVKADPARAMWTCQGRPV